MKLVIFPINGINFHREVSCTLVYTIHDLIFNREDIFVHVGPSYTKLNFAPTSPRRIVRWKPGTSGLRRPLLYSCSYPIVELLSVV